MMKKFLIAVVMFNASALFATAGQDQKITTNTYSCNGNNVQCNFNLNAVGDLFTDSQLGASGLNAQPARAGSISIPMQVGAKQLYSFMPTQAYSNSPIDKAIVNKPMHILFVGQADNGGMKVMTYRKLFGESKWMEMATTLVGAQQVTLQLNLQSNGNAMFTQNGKTQTVTLGRVIPAVSR